MNDSYCSVVIPFIATGATEWHPTDPKVAPLTRGVFFTERAAHAWAAAHIPDADYEIQWYGRVPVQSITIIRAEGRIDECGKPETVATWAEAKRVLFRWSMTAPTSGGYDKCDFRVRWANGETHEGRFDLMHHTVEAPDLAAHVRGFYEVYSGRRIPLHYDNPKDRPAFEAHVRRTVTAREMADCATRLDNYDLGT